MKPYAKQKEVDLEREKKKLKNLGIYVAISALFAMSTIVAGAQSTFECSSDNCKYMFGNVSLNNDMWGAPSGESITQSMYYDSDQKFGWTWSRQDPLSRLPVYPNLLTGVDFWLQPNDILWSTLPKKVSDIHSANLRLGYKYIDVPTGEFNLAYDNWVDTTEVMIWLDCQTYCDPGIYLGDLNDGFNDYKVYWTSPDNDRPWLYVAFVRAGSSSSVNNIQKYYDINYKKMLDYLVSKGKISVDDNVKAIIIGNEIWEGSGKIEINRFNVEINGQNSGPTIQPDGPTIQPDGPTIQPDGPVIQPDVPDRKIGDINEDGAITSTDALLYLRYSVEQDISPYHMSNSDDVTCDITPAITAGDALKVLRKSVNQAINLGC